MIIYTRIIKIIYNLKYDNFVYTYCYDIMIYDMLFLCFWSLFFICNKIVSLAGIFGSSFLSLGHFKCLFASLASKREILFSRNESKSMKSQIQRERKSLFWDWRFLSNSMGTSLKKSSGVKNLEIVLKIQG